MKNHIYDNTWYENADQLLELYKQEPDRTELTVIGLGLTDLSVLERFTRLHTLYVGGIYHTGAHPDHCDMIQDFSALCHLPHLRYLQIHDCQHFNEQQLEYVTTIPHLQGLSVTSFMHIIHDFSSLVNATKLQVLELADISDLTPLSHLAHLRFLHITNRWSEHVIDDFTPLSHLSELQELILEFPAPGTIDLRPLSTISMLKILDLSPCRIGLDVPHLDLLKTQLPECHIIPVSQPAHGKTRRVLRAGIENIFKTWITKYETVPGA